MKRSNRVLLLLGVALAAIAFVGVLALGSFGGDTTPDVPMVLVVVARAELPLGTQLSADLLATEERPLEQAQGSFRTPAELVGRVIRRPAAAGHVLREADFETDAPQAELAGSIPAGLRAIAVALDRVGGVGHLVQAGDRVDVVLTTANGDTPVAFPDPRYPGGSPISFVLEDLDTWINNTSVKVLVQNVQVVGLIRPQAEPGETANLDQTELITILAVTPQQVELVRWAQQAGTVSIVMRSPADSSAGDVPTTGITLRELVDRHGVLPPGHIEPVP